MRKDNRLVDLYRTMLRIRRIEESLAECYKEDHLKCPIHLCIGQEAIPAGVCAHLAEGDQVYSSHRYHGHYLAKGGSLEKLIGEIYRRESGALHGLAGSLYMRDESAGFMATSPIVAGSVPLAVGTAWAIKIKQIKSLVVVFFGDAAIEEGVLHESLNFAVLKKLPILFVCENNDYAAYTPLKNRQPNRSISDLAKAHGMTSVTGNGNDVIEVYDLIGKLAENIKNELGPQFVTFDTHRWREHSGPHFDDDLAYRQEGELESWLSRCPIDAVKNIIIDHDLLNETDFETMEKSISDEFDTVYKKIKQAEFSFSTQSRVANVV